MSQDNLKHTKIYEWYDEGKEPEVYVRVCPVETDRFRQGIALGAVFSRKTRSQAVEFAKDVDKYVDAIIASSQLEKVETEFEKLTNEQRVMLMSCCCKSCGSLDPSCTCMRDE